MAKFNFKAVFEKIGMEFERGLRKRIPAQKGIDGQAYSRPADLTLKLRKQGKGKSSQSTKRLWVSGEFSNEGFGHKASETGVKVFAREVSHSDGLSYAQILRYNSRGQRELNRNIVNPPLVFPTTEAEIKMMEPELKLARTMFEREATKQMKEMAKMNLKVLVKIG